MANPSFKNENYVNFGGINTKYSLYLTAQMEFLNIINYDFQTIGALSQRWGSQQYLGQTFTGQINSLFEFARLDGTSMLVVGITGQGVWYGSTTLGNLYGASISTMSATTSVGINYFGIVSINPPGTIDESNGNGGGIVTSDGQHRFGNGTQGWINPQVYASNKLSMKPINNYLFLADGSKFLKFDGSTFYNIGLPYVMRATTTSGYTVYLDNLTNSGWPVAAISSSGASYGSAMFFIYMTYVNNRGVEGPLTPMSSIGSRILSASMSGGSYIHYGINVRTDAQWGISAINQYVYFLDCGTSNSISSYNSIYSFAGVGGTLSPFLQSPIFISSTPASGSNTTWVTTGLTLSTISSSFLTSNVGPNYSNNNYQNLGATFVYYPTSGGPFNSSVQEFDIVNFYPQFLEVYQNRLFASGFSASPSIVWFSDAAEPEGFAPDYNFEVRTNDADYVTGMLAYLTKLYIFKKNSVHVLSGDNPNNFVLQEVSNIYGCVNNNCAVIFHDQLLFLDRKGLINYNGAGFSIMSLKVQSYFDSMNYTAALKTATMLHDKLRNQILISIPINGATQNNITLVYDYAATAWTTYTGFTPTVYANIQGVFNTRFPFYGDSSGRVNYFGPSLLTDNGSGATLYFKTRFIHDVGDSIQKQYRRLYINADPLTGYTTILGVTTAYSATILNSVNLFQDYGPSIVQSITLSLGAFQERIDFGISGKSLAFEMYSLPTIAPIRINGFTIEQRMQRKV